MTISDKTRKLLWGRSGNRCAYCRRELVMTAVKDNDAIVGDECHIYAKNAGGPRNNLSISIDELDFLSAFMQNLQDWADIGGDMEYGQRVEAGYNLTQDIRTLEEKGFVIFGKRETKKLKIHGVEGYWEIAIIRILRNTNPTIIKIDLSES